MPRGLALWLRVPLRLFRLMLDWASDAVFGLFCAGSHRPLPPISDVLLLDSATALADKIRQGKVTSEQVVRVYQKRAREVNPTLNCLVDTRFDEALEEARRADALVRETEDKSRLARERPFLGVPVTTKDCFAVRGLRWTTGLARRRDVRADFNAPAVQRMVDAGAVFLGVTNVPELCMWWETYNNVYGRTRNPYHTGRMVGGSSGGEACAIAAAASVFGIGSDVGGSIRMPSFFCGIFGHKPSSGEVVPNSGQLPAAKGKINTDYLTTGPMCRYARDLLPMFKVLAGSKKTAELRLDQPVDVSRLRVFYMEDDGGSGGLVSPVHKDMRMAQARLVRQIKEGLGITAKKVNIKNMSNAYSLFAHGMSSEPTAPPFSSELTEGHGEVRPWLELAKWLFGRSSHTLPAIFLAAEGSGKFGPAHPGHQGRLRMIEDLRNEIELMLGDDGVLLYPSHPTPALYHHQALLRYANFCYTAVFNMLGLPSTQCPLGLGSWGVPLGVQVVAAKNRDRLGLALAAEVEKMAGGWVPPSGVV